MGSDERTAALLCHAVSISSRIDNVLSELDTALELLEDLPPASSSEDTVFRRQMLRLKRAQADLRERLDVTQRLTSGHGAPAELHS